MTAKRPASTTADSMRLLMTRATQQGRAGLTTPPVPERDASVERQEPTESAPAPAEAGAAAPEKPARARRTRGNLAVVADATPSSASDTLATDGEPAAPVTAPTQAPTDEEAAPAAPDTPAAAAPVTAPEEGAAPHPPATRKGKARGATRKTAPLPAARALAEPFPADAVLSRRSINLAPEVIEAMSRWLRAQRETARRATLSILVDAALHDLPTDVDALRELAATLPASAYASGNEQLGVRVRKSTLTRIEDAQFELSTLRSKALPLWHCVTAAVVVQLSAEGVDVFRDGDGAAPAS